MRLPHIVAILCALLVMLGISSRADAANATSGLAEPGTYAARHGAPLCDDRAASSYAADPAPPRADGTEIAAMATPGCRDAHIRGERADAGSRDDLQRSQPAPRELAMLTELPATPRFVAILGGVFERRSIDGERCGHVHGLLRPPRAA